ncbi:acyl-CoA thioesterase, partial [Candidatus Sumerlaeota bacterium]|nr:acyl-CoA thioesterase [Candidatus Sumerlaeota bacterium]
MGESVAVPRRAPEVRIMDIVFPADTNSLGTMFGGSVMARMDKAAVMAAIRYQRGLFVTISTDGLQFLTPIKQGDIIECIARVAFVGRTSVVVKVEVYRESHFS